MAETLDVRGKSVSSHRPKIQVISRASRILKALENEPGGLSLGKIAKKVDLARSTVQRIVGALEEEGLLIGSSAGSGVRLGPALLRLAAAVQADQAQIIRPYLAALSTRVNETVDLSVLNGSHAIFVDQIVGRQTLRAVSSIGLAMPLWNTAHGKAMLATMTDDMIKAHFEVLSKEYEAQKIPSFKGLIQEIELIRETGVGFSREEFTEGICAVGSVVGWLSNSLTAISIPIPSQRFYGREDWLTERLLDTVAAIRHAGGLPNL